MDTDDWSSSRRSSRPSSRPSRPSMPAEFVHDSKANLAMRSLDASTFRPSFGRPSECDVTNVPRLKPIRVRKVQRSRQKEPQDIAREQLEKLTRKVASMGDVSETQKAEANFKRKQLEASLGKNTATEERVIALKRTMKTFLRSHGTESERELKCAFHRADVDQSGELDYDEFKDAVKNYGIKTLTAGSLRTLFDSFDVDGGGSISHEEFIQGIRKCPDSLPDNGSSSKRCGPLERPPLMEPKRVGFEAYPVALQLGNSLHVGVAYRTTLTIHNVGDSDLRLTVKLRGDVVRNPVRIVKRPSGPLAPGLKAKAVFEILVRAPGDVACDVIIACGYNQLEVPLTGHFERRTTTAVPLSSTSFADDDLATVKTYQQCTSKLPKHVQRLGTVASASIVPLAASTQVWPSQPEAWDRIQRRAAEAQQVLTSLGPLRGCPQEDMNNICLRLRRFEAKQATALITQNDITSEKRILFIQRGAADVFIDEKCVLTIRAPFYVGDGAILAKEAPTATVTATCDCQGFALQEAEAAVLLSRNNGALNLMHQEMKKRKYERWCAAEGGLLQCNSADPDFVEALLDFAVGLPNNASNLLVKTRYACEHLNFARKCRGEDISWDRVEGLRTVPPSNMGSAFGDVLAECDRLWFAYIREKPLSDQQLERTKGIINSPRKVKGRSDLGNKLVTDDKCRIMLKTRSQAKAAGEAAMLVSVYSELASEVIDSVRKSVIEAFVPSRQYKTWLTNRFPLPEDPEPEEDLGRSARDPVALERKSSWRFDLPELQELNEKPVDYSSVVTAGSSTWGSRPGFTYVPKGQRPRAPPSDVSGEDVYASSSDY